MSLSRQKDYDWVAITNIEKLPEQRETTCIMVDDEEHLYQAGDFVVTHNTEMTKQLANILFEDNRALIRFDMTEYANADMLSQFKDELTTAIWERPYSILLLDEIEKAAGPITRLLLQVLDDARLTDRHGRVVSFSNTYVIATTNAASEIYAEIAKYEGEDDMVNGDIYNDILSLIKRSIMKTTGAGRFPPELLGRFDAVVPFAPLSQETLRKIVFSKFMKIKSEIMRKHGIEVRFDKRVLDYVVNDKISLSDSNAGGAREAISILETNVLAPIAKYINTYPTHRKILVRVAGELKSENKYALKSTATIEIDPI